jgi:hypothetical protein
MLFQVSVFERTRNWDVFKGFSIGVSEKYDIGN